MLLSEVLIHEPVCLIDATPGPAFGRRLDILRLFGCPISSVIPWGRIY